MEEIPQLPKASSRKSKVITFRLPEELYLSFSAKLAQKNAKRSSTLRDLVEKYCRGE